MNLTNIGQSIMIFGFFIFVLGFLFTVGGKIPFLGKLPGDIYIDRENFKFYFPLTTSILLSIILTVILNLFRK